MKRQSTKRPSSKRPPPHLDNVQLVQQYMSQGSPMHQLFAIEAVNRYAQQIIDNKERVIQQMNSGWIDGNSWVQSAEQWINHVHHHRQS